MMLDLSRSQTWSAEVGHAGMRVEVLSGEVWVTREGDPLDHVLGAGEVLASRKRGKLVVLGLSPARLEVTAKAKRILHEARYAHAASR